MVKCCMGPVLWGLCALESGVFALWVPPAPRSWRVWLKRLSESCLFALLVTGGCPVIITGVQAFSWQSWVVTGDAIVGRGAISLCLLMLLLFVDDHIPCVVADVDDTAEVAVGVVVRVAATLLMTFCYTLAPQSPLLICGSCYAHRGPEPPPLARLPIWRYGNRHAWWSEGRIMVDAGLDLCCCEDVLVEIVGVVVVEVFYRFSYATSIVTRYISI